MSLPNLDFGQCVVRDTQVLSSQATKMSRLAGETKIHGFHAGLIRNNIKLLFLHQIKNCILQQELMRWQVQAKVV